MALELIPWDSAAGLNSEEEILAYVEAALEENDPALFAHVLGVVAWVRGMTEVAKKAGLSGENLNKALSSEGNPSIGTIMRVMKALKLELHITQAAE